MTRGGLYVAPPYPVDLERQRGARRQSDLEQPRRVLRPGAYTRPLFG